MSDFDVVYGHADLHPTSRLPLGGIEGKVKVGAFPPGDLCVDPADPTIVNSIITRMQIKAESISIESDRSLQLGNLQYDRNQPSTFSHSHLAQDIQNLLTLCQEEGR
jgi:hypothetical protein